MAKRVLSLEAKVGLFVFASIILFIWLSLQFGEIKWLRKKGYTVIAHLDSATGLERESPIKMAGVRIGRIEDLKLKNGKAEIIISIDPGVTLYKGSNASVKSESLLGQKFIEISDGKPDLGKLENGAIIGQGEVAADIDQLVSKLTNVAESLDEVVSQNRDNLNEILVNVKDVTGELNKILVKNETSFTNAVKNIDQLSARLNVMLSRNEGSIDKTIANFEKFSGTINEKTPEVIDKFAKIGKDLDAVIQENKDNLQKTISEIKESSKSINSIATKIDKGEGTLGKLVNDKTLYDDAKKSLKQLGDSAEQASELSPITSFISSLFFLF